MSHRPRLHSSRIEPARYQRVPHRTRTRVRLLDDKGVRRFVNIYVGEEDIRFLEGLKTELKGGEKITIVPAIAGGC